MASTPRSPTANSSSIVGPSGCGKSTLLRMVAGLEEISDGEIWIAGRVVNDLEPSERDIAMVFQNYALYPHMTVYANMAYGLKIAKVPRGRDQGARRQGGGDPRARAVPAQKAARALRRPAPARRDGPRDRPPALGVPVRRAAFQPRCQAARADAPRDPEAAPRAAHDLALRHPRPGRGDDAGRADDRHERRPHGADRHARRGLPPAGNNLRRQLHRLAADEPGARPRRRRGLHRRRPAAAAAGAGAARRRAGDGNPARARRARHATSPPRAGRCACRRSRCLVPSDWSTACSATRFSPHVSTRRWRIRRSATSSTSRPRRRTCTGSTPRPRRASAH